MPNSATSFLCVFHLIKHESSDCDALPSRTPNAMVVACHNHAIKLIMHSPDLVVSGCIDTLDISVTSCDGQTLSTVPRDNC